MSPLLIISLSANILTLILIIYLIIKIKKLQTDDIAEKILVRFNESLDKINKTLKDEFRENRGEMNLNFKSNREESSKNVNEFGDQLFKRMRDISNLQKDQMETFSKQLNELTGKTETKFDNLQEKISIHLKEIRENNSQKLDEMRKTVDEKLHETLEKRLGDSFKLVSERLELVHKGLGEMQNLASGVGDLKKVLTNVKTRGTWGEIQLGNLIDQILTPDQYEKNAATKKGTQRRVDFAIKLPGRNNDKDEIVWLPIDAKFPLEDYQRLVNAQETGSKEAVEAASKEIEKRIKEQAKSISEKYLDPPSTTDFAIMFLPIEGLFAEVLRTPGLAEKIQHEYRVIITGPTNIAALLNSLQIGFRSLAIEKRSSEVWKLLGAVKTEFRKFGDILDKTHKKLEQATNSIGDASKKTRTIERKLRDVQELPAEDGMNLIDE